VTEWTQELIDTLTALWTEGISTAEIGRRMGVSKCAAVGKAHRIGLASRASPIRAGSASAFTAKRAPKTTLDTAITSESRAADQECVDPKSEFAPVKIIQPKRCTWLDGKVRGKYVQCANDALPLKSFCEMHHRIVYVPTARQQSEKRADVVRPVNQETL